MVWHLGVRRAPTSASRLRFPSSMQPGQAEWPVMPHRVLPPLGPGPALDRDLPRNSLRNHAAEVVTNSRPVPGAPMEERSFTFIMPWRFSPEMGQMRPNPRQAMSCEQQNKRAATPVHQLYSCSPIQLSCQCGTRYQAWRLAMYSVVLQLSSAESVTTSVCACVIFDDKHWPKPRGKVCLHDAA